MFTYSRGTDRLGKASPQTTAVNPVPSTSLHVSSWNIEFGLRVSEAIETIASEPLLNEADVLMVQEMDEEGVSRIADAMDATYCYAAGSTHRMTGRDFGNAVISRHPLTVESPLQLPHKPKFRGEWRIAVTASVEVDGRTVRMVSAHTEIPTLRLKYRVRQFAAVATAAAQSEVAVVGGDFNTLTRRSVASLRSVMNDHGLDTVDLPEPVTLRWPQTTKRSIGLHLDHLFARGLDTTQAGVIKTASASDHWPIWMKASYRDHHDAKRLRSPE